MRLWTLLDISGTFFGGSVKHLFFFRVWTSVGIHIWRTNEVTRLFRQTNGNIYVNFQLIAYINDIFSFLLLFELIFIKLIMIIKIYL